MPKKPLPQSQGRTHYKLDHPPLKAGSKNFVVEIEAKHRHFYLSIPLHPNTDPHCFFWHRHDNGQYLVLRTDSVTPDSGLHVLVTVKGVCIRIGQHPHPGDFPSVKAKNCGTA